MMENVWKWFQRLLLTVILLLVISILGLVAINVPRSFDVAYEFVQSAERSLRSVNRTSERAYEALEELSELEERNG